MSLRARLLCVVPAAHQRRQILEAQAALKQAQLDLGYTEIRAPIAGRISRADFSSGNLVGPDSGVLATIVSQDPIYVTFPVSQRELLAHRGERGDPVVRVTLPDGTLYEHPGKLNFLDVRVDPGTDMLTVRAELPNPDRVLIDGQFVGVRVERGEPKQVLTVPQAIRPARTCWSSATTTRRRRDGSG